MIFQLEQYLIDDEPSLQALCPKAYWQKSHRVRAKRLDLQPDHHRPALRNPQDGKQVDHVRRATPYALHAPRRGKQTILGRHYPPLQPEKGQLLCHQCTCSQESQCAPPLKQHSSIKTNIQQQTTKLHLSHWLQSYLSIIIMISRVLSLFRFCSQVVGTGGNSINPVGKFIAYGHYFPADWTQQFIYSQLDPSKRAITQLQLVRNRLGKATGKVLLRFATEQDMRNCIAKYNEDFIVTKQNAHRVIIKPFQLKTVAKKDLNQKRKTKHAVKIKNLDFDINQQELRRLGKDFGTVEFIQMQIRPNGMNNGLATIYFKRAKEAEDFSYFCHDLVLRDRKLSAEVINFKSKESSQISYLEDPVITIQANQRLYKRMIAEQVRLKQQNDKN